jgi:hypothetical protein
MFSLASKFSTLWLVLFFIMVTSAAFAVEIELPENTIIVEAESGQMDKGVTVVDQDEASEGKAIDSAVQAVTTYEIDIPKAGKWYVWVRLWCPNSGADSFWIGIEGAEPNPNDSAGGPEAVKIYSEAGDSVNTAAQPFNIWYWDAGVKGEPPANRYFDVKEPGKYKLWSKGREATTLLDQILLTMDESFNAEEASQGEAIDIILAVYSKDKLAATWGEIKIGLHLF